MDNKENNLGARLKRLRLDSGFTVDGLAKLAGLSPQNIKDIEAGRRAGGLESVIGLSRAFGISIEAFIGINEPEPNIIKAEKEPVSIFAKKIMSIPDKIYDYAEKFGPNHEVWGEVVASFEDALTDIKEKNKSKTNRS